jgi:D-glycero-alpha-D-manno-heptose-7-phosphate kinase
MIITKTPMRLPLGGGGSDLPEFYEKYGGFWISASVDKYIYVAVKSRFEKQISLHYSQIEEVYHVDKIKHEIIREALRKYGLDSHIEVSSLADLPSRSGMGSSGSFTVGLLHALSVYTRKPIPDLAEEAYNLERNVLSRATGKQDQYTATLGGCRCYDVSRSGLVHYGPPMDVSGLEEHLCLFYTGLLRDADTMIRKVANREEELLKIKHIGEESWEALTAKEWDKFGFLLDEHWRVKRGMVDGMTTSKLDQVYEEALRNSALGGKLVGAGGGGFFLFYIKYPSHRQYIVKKMKDLGLPEVPFRFEKEGSKVMEL